LGFPRSRTTQRVCSAFLRSKPNRVWCVHGDETRTAKAWCRRISGRVCRLPREIVTASRCAPTANSVAGEVTTAMHASPCRSNGLRARQRHELPLARAARRPLDSRMRLQRRWPMQHSRRHRQGQEDRRRHQPHDCDSRIRNAVHRWRRLCG
jgi:hypothetical protein